MTTPAGSVNSVGIGVGGVTFWTDPLPPPHPARTRAPAKAPTMAQGLSQPVRRKIERAKGMAES